MEIDPEFLSEDYVYDTYDDILDEQDINLEEPEVEAGASMINENADAISEATIMGLALSFAAEIAEEERIVVKERYDVNERTDAENMEMVSLLNRGGRRRALTPFEQHVDDVCKGRKKLFGNK